MPVLLWDLEGAESVDDRLRRSVPDRVGAPKDVVLADCTEELPEDVSAS